MEIRMRRDYVAVDEATMDIDLDDLSRYVSEAYGQEISITEEMVDVWSKDSWFINIGEYGYEDNDGQDSTIVSEAIGDYLYEKLEWRLERVWEDSTNTDFYVE